MDAVNAMGKVESLMKFRDALDESERELFDMLMQYAREVALSAGGCVAPARHA
jgi:hypothetical protein